MLDPAERTARFAEGPPRFPRKYLWIAIAVAAVLGVGGAFADHSFNVPSEAPKTVAAKTAPKDSNTTAHFVGLRVLSGKPAPALHLVDQAGTPFSLASTDKRIVILTFLDPRCSDICPVVSAELLQASRDLGSRASQVAYIVVDANPGDIGPGAPVGALEHEGLSLLPHSYFLAGSLKALNKVWTSYGVNVEYQPASRRLAHTNVIYVIARGGRLDFALQPFGNEASSGVFSLPTTEVDRFAAGLAVYAQKAGA